MFGMGFGEILVVALVAILFLGPEKIPETAHTLGKWFHELKRSMDDLKSSFEEDVTARPKKQPLSLPEKSTPPEEKQ